MFRDRLLFSFAAVLLSGGALLPAEAAIEAVISVADQKMAVLRDGGLIAKYPISTSKYGVGDQCRSYRTPLGKLKVCEKIGGDLPSGTVIKHRQVTGEVLPANAPGRDPIVTRILWLDGCEGQNANARERSIYIHGTTEESRIGKPVSYGCIRMRSQDVIALYSDLELGASVTIMPEKLPRYAKYVAPPEILLAKKETALPPIAALEPSKKSALASAAPKEKPIPNPSIAVSHLPEKAVTPEKTLPTPRVALASAPHPAQKPAPVLGTIRVVPAFSTATAATSVGGSSDRPDLSQSMKTSILLSGLADISGNSEIPRLSR